MIDPRDGYATPALDSDALRFASSIVASGSRVAFASLTTNMVTLIEWPHEDDERVTVRWQQPVGRHPLFGRLAIAHDHVYATFTGDYAAAPHRTELAAFRTTDGTQAWRRDLPDRMAVTIVEGGPVVVVAGQSTTTPSEAIALGVDATTGTTRWSYRGPSKLAVAVDRERVVFAHAGMLVVIDRQSGNVRELRAPQIAGLVPADLELADGVAYGTSWLADAKGAIAFAIGLADGRARWAVPLPTTASQLVTAGAIYVVTTGGTIHKLDRATGASQWQWSIGVERNQRLVGVGDRLLVVDPQGITAFAELPAKPREDAVIRGRLTVECGAPAGREVEIGDAIAKVRPDGEFEASVHARGVVAVRPPEFADDIDIELTGRRDYQVGTFEVSDCNVP